MAEPLGAIALNVSDSSPKVLRNSTNETRRDGGGINPRLGHLSH